MHDDALVITTKNHGYNVMRVLIDFGISTDVQFLNALRNMGKDEKDLKKVNFPLMGFATTTTYPLGAITLPVYLGEGLKALTIDITLTMLDAPTSRIVILECSTWNPN